MSMSELDWVDLTLADIPAPVNPTNESNLVTWMANEEPTSQWWGGFGTPSDPTRINPLNTGLGSGGGSGLGSFPDLTTAAHYTAATIDQPNMASIKGALEGSADPVGFGQAVISSPWASSHYGGDVARFTGTHQPGPAVTNPSKIGTATTDTGQPVSSSSSASTPATTTGFLGIPSFSDIKGLVFGALFVAAGAGLVVLGVYKTANPGGSVIKTATGAVKKAGEAAGAAAVIA